MNTQEELIEDIFQYFGLPRGPIDGDWERYEKEFSKLIGFHKLTSPTGKCFELRNKYYD